MTSSASTERWPEDKAWRWYGSQAWPCGFNYIPANAISYTEMWMDYNFDPQLIDRELALAQGVGFNCLRFVLPFVVWEHDPQAFQQRLDAFLEISTRRGLRAMPCLFDDCVFGHDERLKYPWYGKQPDVLPGWYANGWTPSPGHSMVRDPQTWPRLERYVRDIITQFKDDRRVWVWDLYNEPTNGGLGEASPPLVSAVFGWARQAGPAQPLTVGLWDGNEPLNALLLELSDIVTFHHYGNADSLTGRIDKLQRHGRPLINTEWLCRPKGSVVSACLPVFGQHNVGCLHWGLVNGRTQTHLHWGARPDHPQPQVWQHDLYHGDHRAYDQTELDLFRSAIQASRPTIP